MTQAAIDICGDGFASIFWNSKLYKRKPAVSPSHSEPTWFKDTSEGLKETNSKRSRVLERIYQNPSDAILIKRFPRETIEQNIRRLSDIPVTSSVSSPGISWLIDDMVPQATVTLLSTPPASYKTWLAMGLGGAVSQGGRFLGRPTKVCPVLYLDRDNPVELIKERREILHLVEGKNLKIWGNWLQDAPALISDKRLEKFARTYHPLIIFDSFLRFHSADENSAKEMATVMATLRHLTTLGATIILLHHGPKSKQTAYRGSTDILAAVDIALEVSVDRTVNPPTLLIECYKHRFLEEFKLKIRPRLDNGRFEVIEDSTASEGREIVEKITDLLEVHPGSSQEELIKASGLPEHKLRKALHAGKDIHWEERKGSGKTKLYYLHEKH